MLPDFDLVELRVERRSTLTGCIAYLRALRLNGDRASCRLNEWRVAAMDLTDVEDALRRRLPTHQDTERKKLARAYLDGVFDHAAARTAGIGPVPTTLASERADLVAAVCRRFERLLENDEIAALLRITTATASGVGRTLLAVYDDLPELALRSAFVGAKRAGRGSKGALTDAFKVRFASEERMTSAQTELQRRGYLFEVGESSRSIHELFIAKEFPLPDHVAG